MYRLPAAATAMRYNMVKTLKKEEGNAAYNLAKKRVARNGRQVPDKLEKQSVKALSFRFA